MSLERPIVAFRPDVIAGRAVDQLGRDAHPIALDLQATFEDESHTQLACDLAHVQALPL